MVLIRKDAGKSGYIVVIYETHQMLAAINTPLIRTILAMERMGNFKHIHRIKTGENTLIAFIVRTTVQHLVIYN